MQRLFSQNSYSPLNAPTAVDGSYKNVNTQPAETVTNIVLAKDDIVLDPIQHLVRKAGLEIHLQRVDFTLLEFLMRNPTKVFSSESLIENVWGGARTATQDGLRMSVSRLRKALDESDSSKKSIIETIHRVGYRLRA